jgi:DNA-binding Lrp family transcriptional regulator
MDAIDAKLLEMLQEDCRQTHAAMGAQVGLSAPSVHQRVKKLERAGVIRRYVAILDRDAVGQNVVAIVQVSATHPKLKKALEVTLKAHPEVLECYHVTGETDYFLRVVVPQISDLEEFLVGRLVGLPGVGKVVTAICLSELKCETTLPVTALPAQS